MAPARYANDCGFNTPNLYAAPRVEAWLLAEPSVFPDPTCGFMRDLGPVVQLYDRYWTDIKAR